MQNIKKKIKELIDYLKQIDWADIIIDIAVAVCIIIAILFVLFLLWTFIPALLVFLAAVIFVILLIALGAIVQGKWKDK